MATEEKVPVTHKKFAESDAQFRKACDLAGIPATGRQASKYRQGRGLAFGFKNQARQALKQAQYQA